MAANMLRDGRQSTANIAYSVGFNSEAAFNRAFKRGIWRAAGGLAKATKRAQRLADVRTRLPLPPQEVQFAIAADGTRLA